MGAARGSAPPCPAKGTRPLEPGRPRCSGSSPFLPVNSRLRHLRARLRRPVGRRAVPCRSLAMLAVPAGSSRCRRVPGGLPIRLPLRHRSSATTSNAFLRGGRLPSARRCRFPAAQMLISSVMYTFLVGFQRTPGFLCASSLASCVASRGLGRPHETRAKAHRAFGAG